MSSLPCSSEIAHAEDYDRRHGSPRPRIRSGEFHPPQGMCFLCHREPVLPGQSFGLQCSIAADLSWVEGQKLAEIARMM